MSEITFPDQPVIDSIPAELKAIAKIRKVTNLLLSFLDFHVTETDYPLLKMLV